MLPLPGMNRDQDVGTDIVRTCFIQKSLTELLPVLPGQVLLQQSLTRVTAGYSCLGEFLSHRDPAERNVCIKLRAVGKIVLQREAQP